jgi:hypothetical protein
VDRLDLARRDDLLFNCFFDLCFDHLFYPLIFTNKDELPRISFQFPLLIRDIRMGFCHIRIAF